MAVAGVLTCACTLDLRAVPVNRTESYHDDGAVEPERSDSGPADASDGGTPIDASLPAADKTAVRRTCSRANPTRVLSRPRVLSWKLQRQRRLSASAVSDANRNSAPKIEVWQPALQSYSAGISMTYARPRDNLIYFNHLPSGLPLTLQSPAVSSAARDTCRAYLGLHPQMGTSRAQPKAR